MKSGGGISATLLIAALLIVSISCASPQQLQRLQDKSAKFTVTGLNIDPNGVMPNDNVTVTATIKNNGEGEGTYTATLTMGNQELVRKDVLVPPGATETIVFKIDAPQDSGEYKLNIGDTSAMLTVFAWSAYTLQHDNNRAAQYYTWCGGPGGFLSHFQPKSSFFRIRSVRIYGAVRGQDLTNWQERNFTLKIWSKDLSKELWSQSYPYNLFSVTLGWVNIQIPNLRVDGDFCVEVIPNGEYMPDRKQVKCGLAIGLDLSAEKANADIALNGVIQPWSVKQGAGPGLAPKNKAAWMVRVDGESGPQLE